MSGASGTGLGSSGAQLEVVGLAPPSGGTWTISLYRFRYEPYNYGTLVQTQDWATYAETDQQAAIFANNHLVVWGQQLTAQGISYNRLTAVFLGKS